jgi:hypothetical protein
MYPPAAPRFRIAAMTTPKLHTGFADVALGNDAQRVVDGRMVQN